MYWPSRPGRLAKRGRIRTSLTCGNRHGNRNYATKGRRNLRMTSTDMNEIEQLAILGTQAKERRKTNLSDDELRFATELGTAALSKETVDMTAMLDALDSLPVRATAEIVGKSWENLASERKSLLVRWITRRESDRAQKRIVHCASRILPSDPLTTVDFLAVVLPRDQSMSQELKGDLRRAFMGKLAPDL